MKKKLILGLLRDARTAATMERMEVSNICARQTEPVLFENGDAVTEGVVSDFIRERTRIYRESWIISTIDEAIALIKAAK